MEFQRVVDRRRMTRNYRTDPVEPAVIERVLANALRAPSAGNSQGWAFLALTNPAEVERFWRATTPVGGGRDDWSRGMRRAPVVIVPMSSERRYRERYARSDKARRHGEELPWSVPYWHVDTGMAALLIHLTAVDEGLGSCFFGIPAERLPDLRAEFAIADDLTPVGALTLGHPADEELVRGSGRRVPRRRWSDVVHYGDMRPPLT